MIRFALMVESRRRLRTLLVAAAAVASVLLCVRAWLGPFDWWHVHVNSPLVAEGVFSVCIVALALTGGQPGTKLPGAGDLRARMPLLPLAAALGLTAIAFVWNLHDPFIADDYTMVGKSTTDLRTLLPLLKIPWGDGSFRPVTVLYFDVASGWTDWNPWRWHLLSLIRHLVNCGLLFALVWALWRSPFVSFAAAVLFGIHGTRPEVVTWNAANCDSLAVLFALLALLCVFWNAEDEVRAWRLAAAAVFVALAILSKESAYATPVLLVGFAAASGRLRKRPVLAAFVSMALVAAVLFAYRLVLFHGPGGYVDPATGRPQILSLKLLPTSKALFVRLWTTLLLPVNWKAADTTLLFPAVILACAAFLLLVSARKYPRVPVGILLATTTVALVPAIHLAVISENVLGSRVLYLPSLAFCAACGVMLGSIEVPWRRRLALAALIACCAFGLAHNLKAWHRNAVLVDAACTEAAAATSIASAAMPSQVNGVFFLGAALPDCVTMKRAAQARGAKPGPERRER